jgi:hypothetical protein
MPKPIAHGFHVILVPQVVVNLRVAWRNLIMTHGSPTYDTPRDHQEQKAPLRRAARPLIRPRRGSAGQRRPFVRI